MPFPRKWNLPVPIRAGGLFATILLLAVGCADPGGGQSDSRRGRSKEGMAGARADEMIWGRVAQVNSTLRFVVMDFPLRRMPENGQRLNVYRDDQRVGEVRVTGPSQGTTTAGDLLAGEARIGDEVRED